MPEGSDVVRTPEFPDFRDRGYQTVLADPPWPYGDSLPSDGVRGAGEHYDLLDVGHIAGLGRAVNEVTAGNAHCYIWSTGSFLDDAYHVMREWGFTPKTVITWVKPTSADEALPHERDGPARVTPRMGMGQYFRNCVEFMVFGVKGSLNLQRDDLHTVFFAERTDHSAKPEKSFRLIEQASPAPRLELFGRRDRPGWDVWGDEVSDDFDASDVDVDGELSDPSDW